MGQWFEQIVGILRKYGITVDVDGPVIQLASIDKQHLARYSGDEAIIHEAPVSVSLMQWAACCGDDVTINRSFAI